MIAGASWSSAGRFGKSRDGQAEFLQSSLLAIEALSIIGLCNLLASQSAETSSEIPQKA